MKKFVFVLLITGLTLSACASATQQSALVIGSSQSNLPKPTRINDDIIATDPVNVKLATGKPQLIEFFAYWCTTCQTMKPTVNELKTSYDGKVAFVFLDIDDTNTTNLKNSLGYRVQPHFFLVDANGKVVKQWLGVVPKKDLVDVFGTIVP